MTGTIHLKHNFGGYIYYCSGVFIALKVCESIWKLEYIDTNPIVEYLLLLLIGLLSYCFVPASLSRKGNTIFRRVFLCILGYFSGGLTVVGLLAFVSPILESFLGEYSILIIILGFVSGFVLVLRIVVKMDVRDDDDPEDSRLEN